MRELVSQAGKNDNISTIYVSDSSGVFYGAIDLKDLIIAREYVQLESLIATSYPFLNAHEKISDCIERIKDYAEDSLPVLDVQNHILGIITSQDIIEVVDDELGDDYAKLSIIICFAPSFHSAADYRKAYETVFHKLSSISKTFYMISLWQMHQEGL